MRLLRDAVAMENRAREVVLHFGAALGGTTIPTRHPRISVTNDPALDEAITRARTWMGSAPDATIVHDLAIRGAEALTREEGRRREALNELADWATDPTSSMDRETLLHIDELAWRREPA